MYTIDTPHANSRDAGEDSSSHVGRTRLPSTPTSDEKLLPQASQ